MVFLKIRHYFATFRGKLDDEYPTTWQFVRKFLALAKSMSFSLFLTESDALLQLFPGNRVVKTLRRGILLEKLLVLAKSIRFSMFSTKLHTFCDFLL